MLDSAATQEQNQIEEIIEEKIGLRLENSPTQLPEINNSINNKEIEILENLSLFENLHIE